MSTEKKQPVPVTSLETMGDKSPSFSLPVTIKRLDGSEFVLTFQAQGMRKTEWAGIKDTFRKAIADEEAAKARGEEGVPAPEFSLAKVVGDGAARSAELVMKFATGWELTDAFSVATLADLEDRFGGSLNLVMEAYDQATFQGRLGNSAR